MTRDIQLSILDLARISQGQSASQALEESTEVAMLADELGYKRYWFAEHHNLETQISTSPQMLAVHIGGHTKRIRIGAGGVMLPNHSSLKIVEDFATLEALFPKRVDLGIGRAPGTDCLTAYALRRSRESLSKDDFPEQLQDLLHYYRRDFPREHPFSSIVPTADPALKPQIFMLGSSYGGVLFATRYGLGFAFAAHLSPELAVPVLRQYAEQFQPAGWQTESEGIVTKIVFTADTSEEAHEQAAPALLTWVRLATGSFRGPFPTVEEAKAHPWTPAERMAAEMNKARFIIGSVEEVKEEIKRLLTDTRTRELMILDMYTDKEPRMKAYRLLADAFQLGHPQHRPSQ